MNRSTIHHGTTKDCPTPSPSGACPGHDATPLSARLAALTEAVVDAARAVACAGAGRVSAAQWVALSAALAALDATMPCAHPLDARQSRGYAPGQLCGLCGLYLRGAGSSSAS